MESTFIFPLLFSMIPVFILGVIISLIVYAVKKKQLVSTEVAFTPHFILKIYVYFMILASIVVFVAGASFLLNGLFAKQVGDAFSYRPEYVNVPVELDATGNPKYVEPTYAIPPQAMQRDLIRGLTMVSFGLVILIIHILVAHSVESAEERKRSPLYRIYIVLGLSIFTIGSLISIPVGIYKTLSFYLISQPENLDPYQRLVPGESLSSAIAYLPFWVYFIWALYKLQKTQHRLVANASVKPKGKK